MPDFIDLTLEDPMSRVRSDKRPKKRRRTEEPKTGGEPGQGWNMPDHEQTSGISNDSIKPKYIRPSQSNNSVSSPVQPLSSSPEVPAPSQDTAEDPSRSGEHIPTHIPIMSAALLATAETTTPQETPLPLQDAPNTSDADILGNPEISECLEQTFTSREDDPSQRLCAFCRYGFMSGMTEYEVYVSSRVRHEDDPDAWPNVTVLSNPQVEDISSHLKEVHREVWKAIIRVPSALI